MKKNRPTYAVDWLGCNVSRQTLTAAVRMPFVLKNIRSGNNILVLTVYLWRVVQTRQQSLRLRTPVVQRTH